MNPYRHNTKEIEVAQSHHNGLPIKTLEGTIDDVEVQVLYRGETIISHVMSFKGSVPEEIMERYDDPPTAYFDKGSKAYWITMNDAAKSGILWLNEQLCVPWRCVLKAEIIKKTERKAIIRYTTKKQDHNDGDRE